MRLTFRFNTQNICFVNIFSNDFCSLYYLHSFVRALSFVRPRRRLRASSMSFPRLSSGAFFFSSKYRLTPRCDKPLERLSVCDGILFLFFHCTPHFSKIHSHIRVRAPLFKARHFDHYACVSINGS